MGQRYPAQNKDKMPREAAIVSVRFWFSAASLGCLLPICQLHVVPCGQELLPFFLITNRKPEVNVLFKHWQSPLLLRVFRQDRKGRERFCILPGSYQHIDQKNNICQNCCAAKYAAYNKIAAFYSRIIKNCSGIIQGM